jgi:hypothetical protein
MDKPNTTWNNFRTPLPDSPKAIPRPAITIAITPKALATGPEIASKILFKGVSHGMSALEAKAYCVLIKSNIPTATSCVYSFFIDSDMITFFPSFTVEHYRPGMLKQP